MSFFGGGGVNVWRMVGRGRKEKDLMVGQISFYMVVAASSGWMVLCKSGRFGLGSDRRNKNGGT